MYISVRYSSIPNGSALGVLLRMKQWKLFNVLKEMLLPDLSCQRFLWTSFKWVYATLGIGSRDHLGTPQRHCVDAFVGNYIWRNNTGLMSHEVMVRASISLILLMVFPLYIMFYSNLMIWVILAIACMWQKSEMPWLFQMAISYPVNFWESCCYQFFFHLLLPWVTGMAVVVHVLLSIWKAPPFEEINGKK